MTRCIAPTEARTLSWASITPFGVPVVPEVKTSSTIGVRPGRGQASTCASQSAGNASSGSAVSSSRRVVGNAPRPASRGSGASRPVPTIRRFASARAAIRSIASGAIRRSSGTRTSPRRIAPK